MEESFNKLDLTGKLIIKATLGQDIRRIPIHNDDLTYDELVLMMQRVFRGSLDPADELLLKYQDEDGDLVTITDNSDLSFAIQYCRVLRLTLSVSGAEVQGAGCSLVQVTSELRQVRDKVNKVLDMISDKKVVTEEDLGGDGEATSPGEHQGETVVCQEENREFDPLGHQGEVEQQEGQVAAAAGEQTRLDTSDSLTPSLSSSQPIMSPTASGQVYPAPVYPAQVKAEYPTQPAPTYPPPTGGGYTAQAPPPAPYTAPPASSGPPLSGYSEPPAANFHPPSGPPMSGYSAPSTANYPPSVTGTSKAEENLPPSQPPTAYGFAGQPSYAPPQPISAASSYPPSQPVTGAQLGYPASTASQPNYPPTQPSSVAQPGLPPTQPSTAPPSFPPAGLQQQSAQQPSGYPTASYPTYRPTGPPSGPPTGPSFAGGPPSSFSAFQPASGGPLNPYSRGPGASVGYNHPASLNPPTTSYTQ